MIHSFYNLSYICAAAVPEKLKVSTTALNGEEIMLFHSNV